MNKKKLTLDAVLQKLQAGQSMTAVTETDKVKGGITTRVLDGCHTVVAK